MTEKELQARDKRELQQDTEATREGPVFRPEVDIFEQEQSLTLVADVPGASNEDMELDLQEAKLNLTASVRPVEAKWKPIYLEYEIGHYERQFRIGQMIDTDKISAQVKDGVLTVALPKVEKARPRRIQVLSQE